MADRTDFRLQPLRIPSGWTVVWHTLPDADPTPGNIDQFSGSSLIQLRQAKANRLIDVCWRPEDDPSGAFELAAYNCLETFRPKQHDFIYEADWEYPVENLTTRDRTELVHKLEEWLLSLPPWPDPRILLRRGVVDEPAEQLRMQLENDGLDKSLFAEILAAGNARLQGLVLDHPEASRQMVEQLAERGAKKGVRKKAEQKLRSRPSGWRKHRLIIWLLSCTILLGCGTSNQINYQKLRKEDRLTCTRVDSASVTQALRVLDSLNVSEISKGRQLYVYDYALVYYSKWLLWQNPPDLDQSIEWAQRGWAEFGTSDFAWHLTVAYNFKGVCTKAVLFADHFTRLCREEDLTFNKNQLDRIYAGCRD